MTASRLAFRLSMRRCGLFFVIVLVGCSRRGAEDEQMRRATPAFGSAVPAAEGSARGLALPSAHPPPPTMGPVRITPAIQLLEPSLLSHVDTYGWSSDSERFGYCATSDGVGGTRCVFLPHSGPKETFSDWDDAKGDRDPKLVQKQKARLREIDLRSKSGEWAFARDLEIVWDVQGWSLLRVGARVRAHAPSFSILLRDRDETGPAGGIHPDAVVVSPDGKWLGAVGHTFHGEFTDAFEVGIVSVARAAAQAYNDAGYEEHKTSKWAAAADLFERAVDADPAFPRPKYNLACAYARLRDPRTESALRAAVAAAGSDAEETKRKARADPDFAAAAGESWFEDAVR